MHLSNEQIKKIVEERGNQKEIAAGVSHQNRLKFHIETVLHKQDLSDYFREFKDWIGSETPEILAPDKFERFCQLIKAPIQTVELTEAIFSRLYRIFYSQDAYFNYRFTDDSLEADWHEYRDDKFWRVVGFEAMQTSIDSVWVADIPAEQLKEFPEPKNRLIDIADVVWIKNDKYNNCLVVVFQLGDWIYVYDEEMLRAYPYVDKILGEPIEATHDLGYTPARMFWSEKLTSRNLINKESPLTKELTDLDWLLFHQTSKRYLDLANAYPTTVIYEADGDYEDDNITENEGRKGGKRPAGARLMGPGSLLSVNAPRGTDDADLMQNGPIKVISPDIETLKWHVQEEIRLKDTIFKSVVGTDQEVKNDVAKNETQVFSSYESQTSVLMRVKQNFEQIQNFADTTLCRLRYGDRFIGCEIDYGTNFYLKGIDDLQEEMKSAKESGASEVIVSSISDNILNTRYRDDKQNRERAEIISDLDPLPGKTVQEAIDIYKAGGIDKINFIIKSNLINFVKRFERENTNVVIFGSLGNYAKKIEQILDAFREYANVEPNIKENEDFRSTEEIVE